MSERPNADVIDKIRKILKKTEEAGCTQQEAENAFKLASRLIAEHNLSMAEIEKEDGQADDISWLEDDALEHGYRAGRSLNLNRSIGGNAASKKGLPGK